MTDTKIEGKVSDKPYYILSLDGGGVRGVAVISFLKAMEDDIRRDHPDFRLCEFFDMYAGTSIGGMLALLLSNMKYTGDQLNALCSRKILCEIMNKSMWDSVFGIVQHCPKYDGFGKRRVINRHFKTTPFLESHGKQVVIPTYDVEANETHVFRTSKASPHLRCCDVADATSAAPSYFPTVHVKHCEEAAAEERELEGHATKSEPKWLIDGGVVANNPAVCAIAEAHRHLIVKEKCPLREIRVLSIGTGIHDHRLNGHESRNYGGVEWLKNGIIDIIMNQTVVEKQAKWLLHKDCYLRVDSSLGEASSEMDDTSTDNIIELYKLGRKWWREKKVEVRKLLGF